MGSPFKFSNKAVEVTNLGVAGTNGEGTGPGAGWDYYWSPVCNIRNVGG